MFGLVTGLIKGVVDTADTLANSVDEALFGTSDIPQSALRDIRTMKSAGYTDEQIVAYIRAKYL